MIETANSIITSMHIAPRFTPIYPENIFDIIQWCKDYEHFDKFKCGARARFSIGFYQIHQGIEWKDNGVNKYESFAAAVLHFFMVTEYLKLDVVNQLNYINLKDYMKSDLRFVALELLKDLSKCMQMLFYADSANKTKRASRYNPKILEVRLACCIDKLLRCIPIEFRSECFEKATTIICKELK
jgi:hypothetical protein